MELEIKNNFKFPSCILYYKVVYLFRMIFIESKAFTKAAQGLLTEEEMMDLQKGLLQNPKRGVVIPGTRSLEN